MPPTFGILTRPCSVQYCEAVALAERAAKALQSDDAERVWLTRWDRCDQGHGELGNALADFSAVARPQQSFAAGGTGADAKRLRSYGLGAVEW